MVFNCDCIEYMRSLPDKFFNLAIADPPYGAANSDMDCRGGGDSEKGSKDTSNKQIRWRHLGKQIQDSNHAHGGRFARYETCVGGGRNTTMGCRAAKGIFRPAFQSV